MATRIPNPFKACHKQFLSAVTLLFLCIVSPWNLCAANTADFPIFSAIKPNIDFWTKVYSTYSVNTAIIHDQNDLNIIYTTVSLFDTSIPGSRTKNDKRIERAKKHYARILTALAKKNGPSSQEEKRVAGLFGPRYSRNAFKSAASNIRAQTGLKERFSEGVIRSGAYMSEIKKIFARHGLPQDLAYLPHVESSFNPKAFSKFGAAGMWQFTRGTGKEFLRIDYIIDERRDPIISADAAARLLKRNYRLLGSWPLALTAYNYGAAGMKRAVDQEGNYENIFRHYRKGHFKFASRNFYSEFIAAVHVAKQQARSGKVSFDKPRKVVKVTLPAYTNATKLCSHLGVSADTLQEYNPALRQPVFDGTKYIPKGFVIQLPYRLKNSHLLAGAPASIFHKEQKRSQFYQVRSGDTAGAVAIAHNISLKSLIKANQLNNQAMIRVGQNLRIPPARSGKYVPKLPAAIESVREIVLRDSKKTVPGKPEPTFKEDVAVSGNLKVTGISKKQNLITGIIEVQPNESIGILADWLKVTPESIRLTNHISETIDVDPGQIITLEFLNVGPADFEAIRFDYHQEIQEDFFNSYSVAGITTYQVRKGDTVWDICYKKFDLPLWLLKKYNDSLDFNRLDPATSLQVPILKEI